MEKKTVRVYTVLVRIPQIHKEEEGREKELVANTVERWNFSSLSRFPLSDQQLNFPIIPPRTQIPIIPNQLFQTRDYFLLAFLEFHFRSRLVLSKLCVQDRLKTDATR